MKLLLLSILLAHSVCAQPSYQPVLTVSGNFPRDLAPIPDLRMPGQTCGAGPCIWGTGDSSELAIPFHPPAGYRVRILKLRGDLIAWPKVLPGQPAVENAAYSAVLLGFHATSWGAISAVAYTAGGTPLYVQQALHGGDAVTRLFDYDYNQERILLDDDAILYVKLASFLNTTGYPLHCEGTYTITFRFEKESTP